MATPSGANAPYKIEKRGDKYVVVNNTGAVKATFDDEEKARAYQKALYANVPGAAKRAGKVKFTGAHDDRVKALFDQVVDDLLARQSAVGPLTMADGKYPISDQHSANSAWKLRNHSDSHSEAEVVAHIRRACSKLGLHFPGDDDREKAADTSRLMMQLKPHGFVYPGNMPPCSQCGYGANEGAHVNPPRTGSVGLSYIGGERRIVAADKQPMRRLHRTHVYSTGYAGWVGSIPCAACGQTMGAGCHTPGLPIGSASTTAALSPQTAADGGVIDPGTGAGPEEGYGQIVLVRHAFKPLPGETSIAQDYQLCALCGFGADDEVHSGDEDNAQNLVTVKRFAADTGNALASPTRTGRGDTQASDVQRAFVTQLGGKTILTAPATVFTDPEGLPRELAAAWERASAANPHFLWLEGRYVEADMPNRNAAAWSTEDLELGEPTVAHGPLNWLHEERHIVGTIAAAKLVLPDREAANAGSRAHIRSLAAVWRYLWPTEARQIAAASDDRKLWYSMECVSREVACLTAGCTHTQSYGDYMRLPHTRCQHVKAGGARRFADPSFLGGAVILPPVRPGWGGANATVLRQAAMLAEAQQDSLVGLTEAEAVDMVAQIINYAQGDAA